MYAPYRKERFDIVNGQYFWLFVALLAVYLIYSIFDCSSSQGSSDDEFEGCCV